MGILYSRCSVYGDVHLTESSHYAYFIVYGEFLKKCLPSIMPDSRISTLDFPLLRPSLESIPIYSK